MNFFFHILLTKKCEKTKLSLLSSKLVVVVEHRKTDFLEKKIKDLLLSKYKSVEDDRAIIFLYFE